MNSRNAVCRQPGANRTFTVAEANATLPLVRAIVSDLVYLSRDVLERRQRLTLLTAGRQRNSSDPYREELAHIEEEVEKDGRRLQEYVGELRALGVEPASGPEGLVDFPTLLNGRKVFLCWKLGEPNVQYWHEPDAGYPQRQPLRSTSG